MNSQSFEYQLRHAVAPTPDPEARLRARRAALAEFERVHVQKGRPAAVPPAGRAGFHWTSRNAWLGGVASTCVIVIGVSVVWLMPSEDRVIPLHVPIERQAPPVSETVHPAETPSTQAPASPQPVAPAEARNETAPVTPVVQPKAEQDEAPSRVARVGVTVKPTEQPPAPVSEPPAAPSVEPAATELPGTTTNFETGTTTQPEQVVVTGSRIQRPPEMNSPSPVVTVERNRKSKREDASASESHSLEEVTVTATQRSRLRGLFSRRAPAEKVAVVAPPSEGRDKFQHFETNPVKRTKDDAISTFSVDVDTASYSFARRQLNANVLPQADAVRVEEMINYFDYAWPVAESREQPFRPTVTVSDSPWGAGKKLVHIGIKGYALPVRQQPDVNLVLLLDVSGSMSSPDKLPLAQQSMALLLDSLKPTDTVAIVVYAGAAGEVLAPTPVEEKQTILQALNSLRPGGSTAGAAGIRLAYELAEKSFRKGGVNRILLATDGDFNVGITDQNELKSFVEREREKGVYLSVLGFGQGNYRDEMAQTLAQNGNGVAAYIDTLSEAKKVLVRESTASLFTIAKDVKLQVEFNPATVAEYRLVGYETRALNREDFNNDKVDAGDVGSGHTVTAIYEITPVGSKSELIDERRYGGRESASAERQGKANEYGFLKIRYKLPGGFRSRLIEQPILVDAGVPEALEQDVEFSTAVAGFAQLLRGGKYTGRLSFEDVIREAQEALGEDPYGYRAEFIDLVRKAQRARGM